MELGCQVLLDHFGPVYLLQVNKDDDEKPCFSKYFGFGLYFCFHNLIGMWVQSLAFGTPNEKELVDGSDGDCLQIPIRS